MSGIYFHIPFCKQACHYCDFHFSTSLKYKEAMVLTLQKELILRKEYLGDEAIETIYFGGGTPSLLSADEIKRILGTVFENFRVTENMEITIEANPDDLSKEKVDSLRNTPINRFSVGVQSFFEEDLKWMNRAHNAVEADTAIKRLQDSGFENITLDLIYGFPLLSDAKWNMNIQKVVDLNIPHLSAYSMTVESKTPLASFIRKGLQKNMDEQQSAAQFQILCEKLEEHNYEQYEISNFSFPGKYSRHNSNYWFGVPYLGIGPSAHSFNGNQRRWNISNNALYLKSISEGQVNFESETLSIPDKINEYIMTTLRTKWGMDLDFMKTKFDHELIGIIEKSAIAFIENGEIKKENNILTLTPKGKIFADRIASTLFVDKT